MQPGEDYPLKSNSIQIIFLDTNERSMVIQGSLNKFPDFFRMGTFIDSTHMKL